MFWYLGNKRRETSYIRDLVRRYPGFEDRPDSELEPIAVRVRFALVRGRIHLFSLIGAVVAYFLSTPLFALLRWFGLRLSHGWIMLIAITLAVVTWELIRRAYIATEIDRAIAAEHPNVFCTCGYCLQGLPAGSRCPECGK